MLFKKYHVYKIFSKIITIFLILLFVFASSLILLIAKQILSSNQTILAKKQEDNFVEVIFNNAKYNRTKVDYESDLSNYSNKSIGGKDIQNTVTIVTAYFNLGSFQKGDEGQYDPSLYKKWMKIFAKITNPVVFYTDTQDFVDYFKLLRQHYPKNTKINLIDRKTLWAFTIEKATEYIFNQVGYPKHYPNTVLPAYSCSMHAKYELIRNTIIENPFKTKFIAWLDLGLFRNLVDNKSPALESKKLKRFGLKLPHDFNEENIGYTEVRRRNENLTPTDIVYINSVWVCGCFFIGKMDVMFRWTAEYIEGVNWLIRKKLMNTDQQVIYILANSQVIKTQIQTYKDFKGNNWFYLGYLCRDAWLSDKMLKNLSINFN